MPIAASVATTQVFAAPCNGETCHRREVYLCALRVISQVMTTFFAKYWLQGVLLAGVLAGPGICAETPKSRADLPDPLVGAWSMFELSHGNTYPGVFTPFGMLGWTAQMTEGNGWPYQYFR